MNNTNDNNTNNNINNNNMNNNNFTNNDNEINNNKRNINSYNDNKVNNKVNKIVNRRRNNYNNSLRRLIENGNAENKELINNFLNYQNYWNQYFFNKSQEDRYNFGTMNIQIQDIYKKIDELDKNIRELNDNLNETNKRRKKRKLNDNKNSTYAFDSVRNHTYFHNNSTLKDKKTNKNDDIIKITPKDNDKEEIYFITEDFGNSKKNNKNGLFDNLLLTFDNENKAKTSDNKTQNNSETDRKNKDNEKENINSFSYDEKKKNYPFLYVLDEVNYNGSKKKNNEKKMSNPFLNKILDDLLYGNISEKKDEKNNKNDNRDKIYNEKEDVDVPLETEVEEIGEIKTLNNLLEKSKIYENVQKSKELTDEEKKIEYKKGLYVCGKKKYSINIKTLYDLKEPLIKLNSMIGLDEVKNTIVDMILYYMLNCKKKNEKMLHCVIEGPPGVGKTKLGEILAKVFMKLGAISTDKFKIAKRSDLIGEYLGHTAKKTQQIIDEAKDGVLFIDEAYSLGNGEHKDSYSKECIDTLNQNLSENSENFICIIAGYKDELKKCFFSMNPGLERRFPFRFSINGYNANELKKIFLQKLDDINFNYKNINNNFFENFFQKNYESFKNFGGDIENLITYCELVHNRRIFGKHPIESKKIIKEDILQGFEDFKKNYSIEKNYFNHMFI